MTRLTVLSLALLLTLVAPALGQQQPETGVPASEWTVTHSDSLGSGNVYIPAGLVERIVLDVETLEPARRAYTDALRFLLTESGVSLSLSLQHTVQDGEQVVIPVDGPTCRWIGHGNSSLVRDGVEIYRCFPKIVYSEVLETDEGFACAAFVQIDLGNGRDYWIHLDASIAVTTAPPGGVETRVRWTGPFVSPPQEGVQVVVSLPLDFDPDDPTGRVRVVICNQGDAPLDVPARYDGRRVTLFGVGAGHRGVSRLMDRFPFEQERDASISLEPGASHVVLDVPASELLLEGAQPARPLWDWPLRSQPPTSPIRSPGSWEPAALFWAELQLGETRRSSGAVRIAVRESP
ncbi:hypothetical protein OAX78_00075 [Planctomycetota bacterium]|nr:hypothetical protein [Planctomycetota bacterium]